MNLFLIGTAVLVILLTSFSEHLKLARFFGKRSAKPKSLVPHQAITALVMTAQLSELVRTVEHVDIVHMSAAVLLLAVIVAGKSGTEHHSD